MEIGHNRGMIANEHIKIGSNSYEKVKTFKYLGSLLTNQNSIQEEIHFVFLYYFELVLWDAAQVQAVVGEEFPANIWDR